jgi:hypothetical protein
MIPWERRLLDRSKLIETLTPAAKLTLMLKPVAFTHSMALSAMLRSRFSHPRKRLDPPVEAVAIPGEF